MTRRSKKVHLAVRYKTVKSNFNLFQGSRGFIHFKGALKLKFEKYANVCVFKEVVKNGCITFAVHSVHIAVSEHQQQLMEESKKNVRRVSL